MSPAKELDLKTRIASIRYDDLMQSWPAFEAKILNLLATLDLAGKNLECDHVALRVNSVTSAGALRRDFSQLGTIISDNQINGRPILIIELNSPLTLGTFSIPCVELPYPSDKIYPQEGWEHIELVIPSNAQDCETLSQDLQALSPILTPLLSGELEASKGAIKLKMSSPKGDKERLTNPTIAFKQGDICIKVHPHGIKTVIASEQNEETLV
ncbi:VOC family protein [Shewanella profunda]|uniref:VOC family protein n=1 Tax=Shewanella profunda TaxID=254793 RepID=UPI00200F2AF7|nr:VOC family protein [Shewanella profunda]MCL1091958.1 VOC family protein [Shewanella profunda]